MKRVSPVDLFKATPRTNCKECGYKTCMAFATLVIVEKKSIDGCPYLNEETREELRERIIEQQQEGIYVKKDLYKNTAQFIRERLKNCDFSVISQGLGADFTTKEGEDYLSFQYLNKNCFLSKRQIFIEEKPTGDHWDNILLYNYVHFAGNTPIQNEWIPIENIPGHIPKKPELEQGCQDKIATHFEGHISNLQQAAALLGGTVAEDAAHADAAFTFWPLPKVPFFLLFWDHVPDEGFSAQVKILFDRSVTNYLDIESLVFLAEKFAEAMIEADPHHIEKAE